MGKVNFEVHFKSIAVRWFFEVFLIIAAVMLVISVIACALISSVCFERVAAVAEDYAYDFYALNSASAGSFTDTAISLSEAFAYKNKIEVQILDKKGQVIVSTTGFQPNAETIPDYENALNSPSLTAVYRGKNSSGERIMAQTTIIKDQNGNILGARRWITSLTAAYAGINRIIIVITVVFAAVLALCGLSGLFFIKSILRPIREVSNTARKIAAGDLKSKIEFERNDEIGELCDAVNYMASELQSAEQMKNDFISSVSHELRTPLTAIRGWGETAKMSVGTDEELVQRGLQVVLSEADRLSGLVEDLLDFSRMQTGRLSVNTVPVDVSELLRTACDMYIELARKQGIELSYNPPAENSIVMGDPDRLKQVFINVIDNAVKYTEKGGLILVVQSREEGCVQILVKDTGVGIPGKDIDHVKEKFYKANSTVRGSGIGLAVADEIIKQHQGLLFLESTEGVGTTVTIVLPLCEEETEPENTPEQTNPENTDKNII